MEDRKAMDARRSTGNFGVLVHRRSPGMKLPCSDAVVVIVQARDRHSIAALCTAQLAVGGCRRASRRAETRLYSSCRLLKIPVWSPDRHLNATHEGFATARSQCDSFQSAGVARRTPLVNL